MGVRNDADLAAHEVVTLAEVAVRAGAIEPVAEDGAAVGQAAGERAIGAVRRAGGDGVLDGVPVGPHHLGADRTSRLGRLNWNVCTSTAAGGLAASHPAHKARASHACCIARSRGESVGCSPSTPDARGRIGEAGSAA